LSLSPLSLHDALPIWLSLEEAVERPRLHVERDGKTSFEPGFSEREERALLALGEQAHAWPERNLFFGGVHAARAHPRGKVEGARSEEHPSELQSLTHL